MGVEASGGIGVTKGYGSWAGAVRHRSGSPVGLAASRGEAAGSPEHATSRATPRRAVILPLMARSNHGSLGFGIRRSSPLRRRDVAEVPSPWGPPGRPSRGHLRSGPGGGSSLARPDRRGVAPGDDLPR